jgi:hypothetical protein
MCLPLLDAVEAALFVARCGADGGLVIEVANGPFRAAAGLLDAPPGLPAEPVLPATWVRAVRDAAVRGSAGLPPAKLPGRPEPVEAWSIGCPASRPASWAR